MVAESQTWAQKALQEATTKAAQRLRDPRCDPRTIAESLDQTARLVIAEIDAEKSERETVKA